MNMIKDRCEMDSRKSPMMVIIGKKDTGKSFLGARHPLPDPTVIFP
jgi:polynucleotide 5'-kinase involved in rRNA processing